MELIGGVVILLASIGLMTLDEVTLRSILPTGKSRSRRTLQSSGSDDREVRSRREDRGGV